MYFPVFAEESAEPLHVLAGADIEFEIEGKKGGVPTPCKAPIKLTSATPGIRIFWFAASLGDPVLVRQMRGRLLFHVKDTIAGAPKPPAAPRTSIMTVIAHQS